MHLSDEKIQQFLDKSITDHILILETEKHLQECKTCSLKVERYEQLFDVLSVEAETNELSTSFFDHLNVQIQKQKSRKLLMDYTLRGLTAVASVAATLFVFINYYTT